MPIVFQVRDRTGIEYRAKQKASKVKWAQVMRKGKVFQDPASGETFEVFPVGVLAEALDRSTRQIRKWEAEEKIPKPVFGIQKHQYVRWYSSVQIINCHRIMRHRYGGKKYLLTDTHFAQFLADLRAVWYAKEVVVGEDGTLPTERSQS